MIRNVDNQTAHICISISFILCRQFIAKYVYIRCRFTITHLVLSAIFEIVIVKEKNESANYFLISLFFDQEINLNVINV